MTGQPIRLRHLDGDREITGGEWNLLHATSGTLLRAACRGEGLPVSGTNAEKGRRLLAAGLTPAEVLARYGRRRSR